MTNQYKPLGLSELNQQEIERVSQTSREMAEPLSQDTNMRLNNISTAMHESLSGRAITPQQFEAQDEEDAILLALKQRQTQQERDRLDSQVTERSFTDMLTDTGLGVSKSVVSLAEQAYGLANVATIGVDRLTGGTGGNNLDEWTGGFSENFEQTRDIINQNQSEYLQQGRAEFEAEQAEYASGREQRMANRARAAGRENNIWDALKETGGEMTNAMKNLADDPALLSDTVFESALSYLVPGAAANGVRRAGMGIMGAGQKAVREGMTSKELRKRIAKEDAWIGTAAIAGTEGASNSLEAMRRIDDMSDEQLAEQSTIYADLLEDYSPEDARAIVKSNVAMSTFGVTGLISSAASKVTGAGRLEASLFKNAGTGVAKGALSTAGAATSAAGTEAVQEIFESGGGTLAQNLSIREFADSDQELLENVGTAAGMGALAGGVTGGVASGATNTARNVVATASNADKGLARGEAVETVKQDGKESKRFKEFFRKGSKAYNPALAVSQMLDKSVLSQPELKEDPAKMQVHLNNAHKKLIKAQEEAMADVQKLMQEPEPDKDKIKEAYGQVVQLKEQQTSLGKVIDSTYKKSHSAEEISSKLDGVITKSELSDEDARAVFEVFGSSPESVTDSQLTKLEESSSPEIQQRARTYKAAREATQKILTRAEKGIKGVNKDVVVGSPGYPGIQDYMSNIKNSFRLGNSETANKHLQSLAKFAARHSAKASLARDIYSGLQKGEDVSALQTEFQENYSTAATATEKGQDAFINKRSGHMVSALQDEADALNLATMEGQAIVSSMAEANTTDTQENATESVTEAFTTDGINAAESTYPDTGELETKQVSAEPVEIQEQGTPTSEEVTESVAPSEQSETQGATQDEVTTEESKSKKAEPLTKEEGEAQRKKYSKETKATAETKFNESVSMGRNMGNRVDPKAAEKLRSSFVKQMDVALGKLPVKTVQNNIAAFSQGVRDAFSGSTNTSVRNPWYKSGIEQAQKHLMKSYNLAERLVYRTVSDVGKFKMSEMFTARTAKDKPLQVNQDWFETLLTDETKTQDLSQNELAAFEQIKNIRKAFDQALNATETVNGKEVPKYLKGMGIEAAVAKDPTLLLLNDNGQFDPNTVTAMAVNAYTWFNDNYQDLVYGTDSTIKRYLNLTTRDDVPRNPAVTQLRQLGLQATWAQKSLGESVIAALGLKAKKDSTNPEMYQKMEEALGQTTLNLMATKEVNLLNLQSLRIGDFSDLRNQATGEEGASPRNPDAAVVFARAKGKNQDVDGRQRYVPNKRVSQLMNDEARKGYRGAVKTLFDVDSFMQMPTIGKPITFKQKMMKGTRQKVPTGVAGSVQKLMEQPLEYKQTNMKLMDLMGPQLFKKYAGYKNNLRDVHVLDRDNIELGKNPAIERSIEALTDFYEQAGTDQFYVGHEVWKNLRMGWTGPINMQADKVMRHMMTYSAHKTKIKAQGDKEKRTYFKLAVAQHLGIDIDKQSIDRSLKQLHKLTDSTEFKEAVSSIRALERDSDKMDAATIQEHRVKINNAMESTKEKDVAAFDALINWARYEENGEFETDLFIEIDGITNGPIIGLVQTVGESTPGRLKERLNAGGMYFNSNYGDFSEYKEAGNTDTYEFLAESWRKLLTKQQMNVVRTKELPENVAEGLHTIVGDLEEIGRKLSKNPTMITIYGAGTDKVVNETMDELVTRMYQDLMNPRKADQVLEGLRILNITYTQEQQQALENNPADFVLTNEQLSQMKQWFETIYGQSLKVALETTYESFIGARRDMNKSIEVTFHGFNMLYEKAEQAKLRELRETNPDIKQLSKEQSDELFDELADSAPLIKTYFSESIEDSFLAMGAETTDNPDNSFMVTKSYNSTVDNMISTKGKPTKSRSSRPRIERFKSAGVGGFVIGIQAIDAAIMAKTIKKFDVLNVHDAIGVSVSDAVNAGQGINQAFYEVMQEYSLPTEINETLTRMMNRFESVATPGMISQLENRAKIDKKLGIYGFIQERTAQVESIETNKKKILDQAVSVGQYFLPGGALKMSDQLDRLPEQDQANKLADDLIQELNQQLNDEMGSSSETFTEFQPDEEMSVDPGNSLNLLGRFKRLDGNTLSQEHGQQLSRVMGMVVNRVLAPVQVAIENNSQATMGRFFAKGNRIELSMANPAINETLQTQSEVYVHELLHTVTHFGLENNIPVRREIQLIFNAVSKHVKASDFYPDSATATQKKKAEAMFDYVFNNAEKQPVTHTDAITGTITTHYKNASLHEFVAYALTNEKMIAAMNKPEVEQELSKTAGTMFKRQQTKGGFLPKLMNTVVNWFMQQVEKMFDGIRTGKMKIKGLSPADAMMVLAQKISETEQNAGDRISKTHKILDTADSFVANKISQFINGPMRKLVQTQMIKGSRFGVVRSAGGIIEKAENLNAQVYMDTVRTVTRRMGLMHKSLLASLAREMRGQHKGNRRFYGLLRKSKTHIDQAAKTAAIEMKALIRENYATPISDEESVAILRTFLATDLASLLITDNNLRTNTQSEIDDALLGPKGKQTREKNVQYVMDVVRDSDFRAQEISRMESELRAIPGMSTQLGTYYLEQAKGLGGFMTTKSGIADNQMKNAYAIANLAGGMSTYYTPSQNTEKAQVLIDRLASLHGLNNTDKADIDAAMSVFDREIKAGKTLDDNGLTFTLQTASQFKQDSMTALFNGSPMQMIKGYTREIIDPSITLATAPRSQEKEMAKKGFKRVGLIGRDKDDPASGVPLHLYKSTTAKPGIWQKGIASLVAEKAKGVDIMQASKNSSTFDIYGGYQELSNAEARKIMERIKRRKTANAGRAGNSPRTFEDASLVPVLDDQGNITGYNYLMKEDTRREVLNREEHFDEVMGQMFGYMTNKVESPKINRETIEALKEEYDNNFADDPTRFIKLAPNALGQPNVKEAANYKEYEEMWHMLPHKMQQDAIDVFGESALYIPDDLYALVFGYRKNNMRDFTKKWQESATQPVMKMVTKQLNSLATHKGFVWTEDVWKELVAMAKDAIVIKSGVVLVGNIISNVMMLGMSGVGPKAIVKHHRDGYRFINEYQDAIHERDRLQLKLKISKNLSDSQIKQTKAKIAKLENDIESNPVRELMDAGVYQSIVEDVSMEEDPFSFKGRIDKFVQPALKRTPQILKDVGNMAFITHDTQMYKALRNTTQISDFVARYTLHQVNKERGMDTADSINDVMESFIDYEAPTHEAIQYGNDIGLIMFTKFFFRIQKMLFKRMSERPASVLSALLLQQAIGYDLDDVFDAAGWDTDNIANRQYSPTFVWESILKGNVTNFELTSGILKPM